MATFCLIPGACHGAWCWERVVPALEDRGHDAIAVDLPCEDATAGFERYVEVTLAACAGVEDGLIFVGHSLGAHTAVRAAKARANAGVVFVCGVIPPREGERGDDEPEMEAPGTFDRLERDEQGRFWFPDPADAIAAFFGDCDPTTATWAASMLRRQSTTPHAQLGEAVSPPPGPMVSIVCADDRVARADWGRWAARERLLGAPVVELPGSHSPFLSRPEALAEAMVASLNEMIPRRT